MSKHAEARLRGLATRLTHQTEGSIEQITAIRFSWARRREVEGRYNSAGEEVKTRISVFDLSLEDSPGDPPREPDAREPNAEEAARRLLTYETWVRTS